MEPSPEQLTRETASGTLGIFLILLPIVLIVIGTIVTMFVDENAGILSLIHI